MLLVKVPLYYPELVAKAALGFGENVDLSDGFSPRFGVGWLYGIDLHLPMTSTSGVTCSLTGFQTITADRGHQIAIAAGVGYTWF